MEYWISLFDLNFDEEKERAVLETLRSKWISMGPKTALLEERFAAHLGAENAVAVNSCTAALHLALAVLGVSGGDEVIVPSLTFVATVNVLRYVGARPVFADITSLHDFSIDPEDVLRKITSRTRVVIPMHYGGFARDMDRLQVIAREHKLCAVEEAAHAPDSQLGGRRLGTIGDIGCFSFFSNNNMTCAEGGLLTARDAEHARRTRRMRSHGMTALSYERARGHATTYDVVEQGYNYRLDDLRASIALAQLEKLRTDAEARRQIRAWYVERLREVDSLIIPYLTHRDVSSDYIFPVLIKDRGIERRDAIREKLRDVGIQTSVHYPAVHRFSMYRDYGTVLPITERVADSEITLPMYGSLTEDQVTYITDRLKAALST